MRRRFRFLRHPLCSCRNVPTFDGSGDSLRTDPQALFDALSAEEADHAFTRPVADALRGGADPIHVVNEHQRALGLSVPGRAVPTADAAGPAPRVMPAALSDRARNRDDAVDLLRRAGYLSEAA